MKITEFYLIWKKVFRVNHYRKKKSLGLITVTTVAPHSSYHRRLTKSHYHLSQYMLFRSDQNLAGGTGIVSSFGFGGHVPIFLAVWYSGVIIVAIDECIFDRIVGEL